MKKSRKKGSSKKDRRKDKNIDKSKDTDKGTKPDRERARSRESIIEIQKEIKLDKKQSKILSNLLEELVQKQDSYVNGLTAHFAFMRHVEYEKMINNKKKKWYAEVNLTASSDLTILSSLLFVAKELLYTFQEALDAGTDSHKVQIFAYGMGSKVIEMFLHSFALATQRYEEINVATAAPGPMQKLYKVKIPKLANSLGGKLHKKNPSLSVQTDERKRPSFNVSIELDSSELTAAGCDILKRDGYNPWISTIQRAVQLRSFLERVVKEALVPKQMKSNKDIFTIQGYKKLRKTINDPNAPYTKKVISATERYRKLSMDAEKQFSEHEKTKDRIENAAKANARGMKLMKHVGDKKGKNSVNLVKAKDEFAEAVQKDGSKYMYHQNFGETCQLMGFYKDASHALLKGIKLREGEDSLLRGGKNTKAWKENLESKIKALTAEYELELEAHKKKIVEQAKKFEREKGELKNQIDELTKLLEKSTKKIEQIEEEAKLHASALEAYNQRARVLSKQLKQENVEKKKEKEKELAKAKEKVQQLTHKRQKSVQLLETEKNTTNKKKEKIVASKKRLEYLDLKIKMEQRRVNRNNKSLMNLQKIDKIESGRNDRADEEEFEILQAENLTLTKKLKRLQKEKKSVLNNISKLETQLGTIEKETECKKCDDEKKKDDLPEQMNPVTRTRSRSRDGGPSDIDKDYLLNILCTGGLFSARVNVKRSDLKILLTLFPNQTLEETCLLCERFSRHRIRFSSILNLQEGIKKAHGEYTTSKNKILSFLKGSSCKLWENEVPDITLEDMDEFDLLVDTFYAFLNREIPINLLKPISIADMENAVLNGLQKVQEGGTKCTMLQQIIIGLEVKHSEELRRQDGVLEKSKSHIQIVVDFFNSGVAIFTKQLNIDINYIKRLIAVSNGSGAECRRRLEKLVVHQKVFASLDALENAIKNK